MKKIILLSIVLFSVLCAKAGEGDELIHLNAGFLFQSTLNVSLGWEKELAYDNAIEFFGEAGDRWTKDPECGKVCRKSFLEALLLGRRFHLQKISQALAQLKS